MSNKIKHILCITFYYFLSIVCMALVPFGTERWSIDYDINPDWSWNKDHISSTTNHYHEHYTVFQTIEDTPIILVLFIFLLILSIVIFIIKIKVKENEKILKILLFIMLGLGLVILICQWAIIGFSLWGTAYTIILCLFPLLYDQFIDDELAN